MNPDPTTAISLDYLVEFNDDANHPERPDPEVIIIPPSSHGMNDSTAPAQKPED